MYEVGYIVVFVAPELKIYNFQIENCFGRFLDEEAFRSLN